MTKDDNQVWIEPQATLDELIDFMRKNEAVVGIAECGQHESKIYVGDNFGIPIQTSTVDQLKERGLLQPCEGIVSPDKQFFELAIP